MTTIHDDIAKIRKDIDAKKAEADRLQRLSEAYPLQKHVGRWNKVAYFSASVNSKVDRFDQRFNCGCCRDSPLEVWPYLETQDGKVFSSPPRFIVGGKHWIDGASPRKGWKEEMTRAGIPKAILDSIQAYFTQCQEERIRIASKDDEISGEDEENNPLLCI